MMDNDELHYWAFWDSFYEECEEDEEEENYG